MADEPAPSAVIPETVVFIVGLLVVLGAIWWVRGGPNQHTDTSGTATTTPQTATSTDTSVTTQTQY